MKPFHERPRREQQQGIVSYVRQSLEQLRAKAGYIVVNNIGAYDFNPYDMPLPDEQFPQVFRALYEAVDYAKSYLKRYGGGGQKLKIVRVDGATVPGTNALGSEVVWRSWDPK